MSTPQTVAAGVVTSDPLAELPHSAVRVTPRLFQIAAIENVSHGFAEVGAFEGILLALGFRTAGEHHTLGSAVLVHPGLAITAKHVVAEWTPLIARGEATIVGQAPTPSGLLMWQVEAVSEMHNSDLAVLSLRLRVEMPDDFSTCHIETRMPSIGDVVFLTGFTVHTSTIDISPRMEVDGLIRVCHGAVCDLWPNGRDSVMLPSSSFAVRCPAFGGMSGGPVFNAEGKMLGVVSSSLDGDDIACVSHVAPALLMAVRPAWPLEMAETTLLGMGKKLGVTISDPAVFKFNTSDGNFRIVYAP